MFSAVSLSLYRTREFFRYPVNRALSSMAIGQVMSHAIPAPPLVRVVRAVANVAFYKLGIELERLQNEYSPAQILGIALPIAAGYAELFGVEYGYGKDYVSALNLLTCFGYLFSTIGAKTMHQALRTVREPSVL